MNDRLHTSFVERLGGCTHRNRKAFLVVLAALAVAYCLGDTVSFLRAIKRDDRKPTLERWLPQAAEIGQSDRFYESHPDYLYPPGFLVLLKPLTHLPIEAAGVLWQLAKYACIVVIFAAAWRMFAFTGPVPPWIKIASIIVAARFVHSDLRHGNINIFIAALVVGGGWALVTRRSFLAGLLVALAACVKVTPVLWCIYLLYRLNGRALAGCAVAAVLMLEVIPSAVLGVERNHALLAEWRAHVIGSFLKGGEIDSVGMNQSLTAVTNRWLGHSTVLAEDRIAIVALQDSTIRRVQQGIAITILLITGLAILRRKRRPDVVEPAPASRADDDRATLVYEWALLAPVTLALSGYTWTGHFCLLVPALVGAFAFLERTRREGRLDRAVAGLVIVASAIFVLTSDILTEAGREWTTRVGAPLFAAMLIWLALVRVRAKGAV
ncbi:MAG TPA: glycosyltransferase family 87 protein [Phycisphaerae bacterium]|nr:glycosyltransferase family 87 protein [Phycisphaerae bacterium]